MEGDPSYIRYIEYDQNEDTKDGTYKFKEIEQGPHKGDMLVLRKDFW